MARKSALAFLIVGLCILSGPAVVQAEEFQAFVIDKTKYKGLKKAPKATDVPKKLYKAKFQAKGTFTLGAANDGLDFVNDEARITFGDVITEIAAGELKVLGNGGAKYSSKDLNQVKKFIVSPTGTPDQYKFQVKASKTATAPPEFLTIEIRDDLGQYDFEESDYKRGGRARVTPRAMIQGYVINRAGEKLSGIRVATLCPAGVCRARTRTGYFRMPISLGAQIVKFLRTPSGGVVYAGRAVRIGIKAGENALRVVPLVAIDLSTAQGVSDGVQGAPTIVQTSPLSVGGTARARIPAGSTVTFPPDIISPQDVTISEVKRADRPRGMKAAYATKVMILVAPAGTDVSPCGDLVFPNPFSGLSDGNSVDILYYDDSIDEYVLAGTGTVQNGETEISASGVMCELGYYFPSCSPATTTVIGQLLINGRLAPPRIAVVVDGEETLTRSPKDLNGDGVLENVFVFNHAIGCAGSPEDVGLAAYGSFGYGGAVTKVFSEVTGVPSGFTDFGPIALGVTPCGVFADTWPLASTPIVIAADFGGSVYVAVGTEIQKFSPTGTALATWDGSAGAGGAFAGPVGIAVDEDDNIYVADSAGKIQKFDSDGNYLDDWSVTDVGPVAADGDKIFMLQPIAAHVITYDQSGTQLDDWAVTLSVALPESPVGIAAGSSLVTVALDNFRSTTLQLYTQAGTLAHSDTFGASLMAKAGIFQASMGAVGTRVYLPEPVKSAVLGITKGILTVQWGRAGLDPGTFEKASLIGTAAGGDSVYTIETGMVSGVPRVQRFLCP